MGHPQGPPDLSRSHAPIRCPPRAPNQRLAGGGFRALTWPLHRSPRVRLLCQDYGEWHFGGREKNNGAQPAGHLHFSHADLASSLQNASAGSPHPRLPPAPHCPILSSSGGSPSPQQPPTRPELSSTSAPCSEPGPRCVGALLGDWYLLSGRNSLPASSEHGRQVARRWAGWLGQRQTAEGGTEPLSSHTPP